MWMGNLWENDIFTSGGRAYVSKNLGVPRNGNSARNQLFWRGRVLRSTRYFAAPPNAKPDKKATDSKEVVLLEDS